MFARKFGIIWENTYIWFEENFRTAPYAYMFRLYAHKHREIAELFLAYQHLKKKDCFHLSQFDPGGVLPYKSDGGARRKN